MTFRWTKAAKAQLAEMLEQGLSASEIGARLDISRNAVIGAVHRDPALRTIGLRGKPGNASGGQAPYPKPEPKPASTDREMIDSFVETQGVRRFGQKETTDYWAVQGWLRERGYRLTIVGSTFRLSKGTGRPRTWRHWRDVIGFVDELRAGEGLPAFLASSTLARRRVAA